MTFLSSFDPCLFQWGWSVLHAAVRAVDVFFLVVIVLGQVLQYSGEDVARYLLFDKGFPV